MYLADAVQIHHPIFALQPSIPASLCQPGRGNGLPHLVQAVLAVLLCTKESRRVGLLRF